MSFLVRIENEQGSLKLMLRIEEQEEAQKIYEEMVNKLYEDDCIIQLIDEDFNTLKASVNKSY